ncbi:MAG: hypothetical protein R2695_06620 [Acidimicrobiales bacterium]
MKIMQERAFANLKIEFLWNTTVEAYLGDSQLTGLRVRDVNSGEMIPSSVACSWRSATLPTPICSPHQLAKDTTATS